MDISDNSENTGRHQLHLHQQRSPAAVTMSPEAASTSPETTTSPTSSTPPMPSATSATSVSRSSGKHAAAGKAVFRCQICAADSIYHYYGVQSCEGCKQFFRRIVVKQKDFKCWKQAQCVIGKGERCRSCRLDLCLLTGMDPRMVNIRKTVQLQKFIEVLEKRRIRLFEDHQIDKFQQIQFNAKFNNSGITASREGKEESSSPMSTKDNASQEVVNQLAEMSASLERALVEKSNNGEAASSNMACADTKTSHFALTESTQLSTLVLAQCLGVPHQSQQLQPPQFQQTLLAPASSFLSPAPAVTNFRDLDSLLIMENCLKRIWFSDSALSPNYLERHQQLQGLLNDPNNLLASAKQFLNTPIVAPEPELFTQKAQQAQTLMFPEHLHAVIKDRFLCIEMAKAMPSFGKLSSSDQVALLRYIVGPVTMFINAFYSFLMSADTWTRSNGFMNITVFNQAPFVQDERIMNLTQQMFCDSVDAFKRAAIGREEFVLLMAVLFSSSTASNLSQPARELLYDESVRYSKALLSMLQVKHGHINGSQKYALAMELLSAAFKFDYRTQMLNTYMDVFHSNDPSSSKHRSSIFPRVLANTPLAQP